MELYLDSVNFEEIPAALDLGFLTGVTTTDKGLLVNMHLVYMSSSLYVQ